MMKLIRQNPMIAAGILLPLLIVIFFVLATMIPRWLVAPPQYDFVFTSTHNSNAGPAMELSIVVEEERVKARVYTSDRTYRNVPKLFLYEQATESAREISIKLPADADNIEDGGYIEIPELASRKAMTSRIAPDGYEIRGPGYRGGNMMFPFYNRRRAYSFTLHKNGAVLEIPESEQAYYYSASFVGWLTD